jgi:hypothetical protein
MPDQTLGGWLAGWLAGQVEKKTFWWGNFFASETL